MGVGVSESNRSMSPEHSETNHAAIHPIALRTRSIVASIESPSAQSKGPLGAAAECGELGLYASPEERRRRVLVRSRTRCTTRCGTPSQIELTRAGSGCVLCFDRSGAHNRSTCAFGRAIAALARKIQAPGLQDASSQAGTLLRGVGPPRPDDCCCRCLWFPFLVHVK